MVSTVSEKRASCGQHSLRKEGFLWSAHSQKRGLPVVGTVSEKRASCGQHSLRKEGFLRSAPSQKGGFSAVSIV